jgi:hypothetical protein
LVVLENVGHGFRKPNILDIKLGTLLYDEDAPPEKKAKMEAKTRGTTSGEAGIRLTGFQVGVGFSSEWLALSTHGDWRSLAIKHRNPSLFRKHMGDLFALQNFLQGSHGFSPSIIQ